MDYAYRFSKRLGVGGFIELHGTAPGGCALAECLKRFFPLFQVFQLFSYGILIESRGSWVFFSFRQQGAHLRYVA